MKVIFFYSHFNQICHCSPLITISIICNFLSLRSLIFFGFYWFKFHFFLNNFN